MTRATVIRDWAMPTLALLACQAPTVQVGEMRFLATAVRAGNAPTAVAATDIDGDHHLDLVVANQDSDNLTIFRGDGTGNLVRLGAVPAGENPGSVALADIDEDGDIDIVVANHETDYLTILRGLGDGEFRPAPNSPQRIPVSPHPHVVRAADLDADGHIDLLVDDRNGHGIRIIRGMGEGRFESQPQLVGVGGDPYRGFALADINGDGQLDLLTPNPTEVAIRLSASDATLRFVEAAAVVAPTPFYVELGDLNGDGVLDLITVSERDRFVKVFPGNGNGSFNAADVIDFQMSGGAKRIIVGDFNGDGTTDAAVADFQSPDVLLLFGGRSGIRSGTLSAGEHPWGMVAADFNEDGMDDLVVADYADSQVAVFLTQHE